MIGIGIFNIKSKVLPIINTPIPAGFPSPAADYIEETIDLNHLLIKNPSATFFVRVEGESMIEAFIPPKALLLVDKSINASSGHIVVAVLNGEFTVKRLLITQAGTFLTPANPKYKPIRITEEMNFQVWGVVSKVIIDSLDI
ncbi:MAG: translesion error-prone DNA polymerase V autoproteolytic subunit [Chitinophagaceae bacterium]